MEAKKKLKIGVFELVCYIITGAVALWGLTYIVLGLIANYADVPAEKNYLAEASKTIANKFGGLDFLGWGLIIFGIGVVVGVLVLLICSAKFDKTNEKAARRAARLAKIEADMNASEETASK